MKKKVTFVAYNDYANVLTEWSNSINLNSKDFVSKSICLKPHVFNYKLKHDIDLEDAKDNILKEAREWMEQSSYIIYSEELPPKRKFNATKKKFLNLGININDSLAFRDNKITAYYGGTAYRNYYKALNDRNSTFSKRIYAPDLYRLSKKEKDDLVIFPTKSGFVDKEGLIREVISKYNNEKIRIIHSPSGLKRKGSPTIKRYIDAIIPRINKNPEYLNFEYILATNMSNIEIIELKRSSHIHIDQFNKAGGFGVSSIESMMFGNIILCTMNNTPDLISKKFGKNTKFPIIGLDSEDEVSIGIALNSVLKMNKDELISKSIDTINWYFKNASQKAVSENFEKMVLI
jgi:hypothetical protein